MSTATDILRTMNITPGSLGAIAPATGKGGADGGGAATALPGVFAQTMQEHLQAGAAAKETTTTKEEAQRQAHAEKAAGDLISNALILPMLKQLRRSPWGQNTVFSPGMGEKAFGPQFDMQISDRIAHSPRLGIKKALTEKLIKRGQPNVSSNHNTPAESHGGINLHG